VVYQKQQAEVKGEALGRLLSNPIFVVRG